jgi:dTDP-4-dehydrorhamnose 3,5-epimerase
MWQRKACTAALVRRQATRTRDFLVREIVMKNAVSTSAMIKVVPTSIPDVLVLEPRVFHEDRGFFMESYNRKTIAAAGIHEEFVQDNQSRSIKNVLRGLHYQIARPQGKLVRVLTGEIFDVAVDLRRSSPTFGRSAWARLSAENKRQLWVPAGFAHGFLAVSDTADVLYKVTDYYAPEYERSLLWSDPALAIPWPIERDPLLSSKDARGARLEDAELFA